MVRWIYQTYLAGASYNKLAASLQRSDVPYVLGKLWNKNMVARILADARYTRDTEYPSLITLEQFQAVQTRRENQAAPPQKTPAQKELRRLCGSTPPRWVEQQVLAILNNLIAHPEQVRYTPNGNGPLAEAVRLRRDLDVILNTPPVDENRARAMALRLAELQLNAIGSEEYETVRLQTIFRTHSPTDELDQALLHESIRHITYSGRTVSILLKNNQIMEGGDTQ